MPVTQKDIAREVGVSQTVVSDVLQERPDARVSPATRQRIIETARRLGYRPNASARSLRTRRAHLIAYVIAADAVSGYALGEQALGALAGTLAEHDFQLNLRLLATQADAAKEVADLCASGQCDGVVVRVARNRAWDLSALADLGYPILVLGHGREDSLASIAFDVSGSVTRICAHLRERGHRHVLLLNAPFAVDFYDHLRVAWSDAVPQAGLSGTITEAGERHAAAEAVRRLLRNAKQTAPPTAFVCLTAAAALGVAETLREAGRHVGQEADVVVIGQPVFGEDLPVGLLPPGIWYLDHDQRSVGRLAAEEILRLVAGEPAYGARLILPALRQAGGK